MTSYLIYSRGASGMTSGKWFIARAQPLGEFPICALYEVLWESAQRLPSQTRQPILQVPIRQMHAFPSFHGNNI